MRLRDNPEVNRFDLLQILVGYSKSQCLSKDFQHVLEHFFCKCFGDLRPREISNMIYTFSLNNHRSYQIIDRVKERVMSHPEQFNIEELAHILVALDKQGELTEELLALFESQFILKSEHANISDLADFCMVFFKNAYVKDDFILKVRELYRILEKNVDYLTLSKLLTNVGDLVNKQLFPHRFLKKLLHKVGEIAGKGDIKGRVMTQLQKEAQKILHVQFRLQFLGVLQGKPLEKVKESTSTKTPSEQVHD